MTPEEYCQDKAAKSGSSFYYSFLFLPFEQRRAITALYAFCREVDDIVDECSDAQIAQIKLQWWRDSMKKTVEGEPQHPIQHALVKPIGDYDLPLSLFLDIIDGMEMDLKQQRYENFEQLRGYCYRAASAVGLLAARIFGFHDQGVLDYADKLGMAFQLTNILRDVSEDAQRQRIYIPLDELKEFGVSEQDLKGKVTTKAMQQLFEHQYQRAENYYQQAFDALPKQDRYAQRCGVIMAAIYHQVLTNIKNNDYRVMEQRISLSPIKKLWLAWRTARKEKKLHATLSTSPAASQS